ncbi:hypothetical protein AB4305_28985 [Nocardia sp. 2YAB30]|uniref:hypothetical protein n=1 Tax=unclassified Nocardia TaxID=2637762 RepID=UPI003F9A5DEE
MTFDVGRRGRRLCEPPFLMALEPELWDTERWRPQAVLQRCRDWVAATRRRRWTAWILVVLFVLFVCPGIVGALATADTSALTAVSAPNSALGWMNVKDTSGVELSSYILALNRGGVFNPGKTVLSLLISVLFAIWLVLVTTGVWLPGQTVSFTWLNMFSAPLRAVADNLTAHIATPIVLVTFVTIGGVPVGWFIVRGYHAKAVMQVVTMLTVAILGPFFLVAPLSKVLSSDGLLVQGRDLGISVAAGLNGNSNPNPNQLVAKMQTDMADNFARKPLQVWNFGHVVDDRPSCKAAWSAGVMAGDEDRVKDSMKTCGDSAAYAAADNPSVGQIGAGLLLLLSAAVLLLFAAYLALKVIWAALDTIYYGFMTIFGFAAGGFVYGPTQTFTVRCVVHGFVAAAKMAVFIIFLGIYELFLGSLFQQARGQVMSVFVIGAIVEVVAIMQLRRLSRGLDSGNDWIANRFAMAIQSGFAKDGGGGGGTALGMGTAGAGNSLTGLAMFGAASTISGSPITSWLAGGTRDPLNANARDASRANKLGWSIAKEFGEEMKNPHYDRRSLGDFAQAGIRSSKAHPSSQLAAAYAAESVSNLTGGNMGSVSAALSKVGFGWRIAQKATAVQADILRHADAEPLASAHLARVIAAHKHFEQDMDNSTWSEARLGGLRATVGRYRHHNSGGVTIPDGMVHLGRSYLDRPTHGFIETLQEMADGKSVDKPLLWTNSQGVATPLKKREAERLQKWITNEHALRVQAATDWVSQNPTDFQRVRRLREEINNASATNHWQSGRPRTGATSLSPPWKSDTNFLPDIPQEILENTRNH